MTEKQKQTVDTIKQIALMIEQGKMSLEMCPVSDLKTVLYCVLDYKDNMDITKQVVEQYCELLEKTISNAQISDCCKLLMIMAHYISYELEKNAIYKEEYSQVVQELQNIKNKNHLYDEIIDCYKQNKIDEGFINEHTYQSLVAIKEKGNIELFKKVSKEIHDLQIENIKLKENKKIVFFLKDSAEWSCEELYKKYAANPKYNVEIVVAPFFVGTEKTIYDTYFNTINYFKDCGYNTIGIYDVYQGRYKSWREIGIPDIVIHLNPHYTAFRQTGSICNFPLSILNVYIPYGFMIYGNTEHQFNQLSHMLYWKIFCESVIHKEMAKKYSDIGDMNVVNSGYVKMDSFYLDNKIEYRKIWKISGNADEKNVKRIIYAPHWSVKDAFTGFGNFDKIYNEIYNYAKENQATTSWVFRPHPMLRAGVVQQGVFNDEHEYDKYLDMWNKLPNAQVIEGGTYIDIFKSSDAMILDSVSFMAEYLYLHKPMLFLTRERNTFNDFGNALVEVLYKTEGGNFEGIKEFIENVVIDEKDFMKKQRECFFENYLDYYKINGLYASDYIFNYINEIINER